MSNIGWIRLHRQITDCWVWDDDEPYTKAQAWIYLLMIVNHTEAKTYFDGDIITVNTGQRITSIRKLADKFKWSRTKVTHFLSLLEQDNMVKVESDSKKTLITVINYEKYQSDEPQESHKKDSEKPQESHRKATDEPLKSTNNNDNNDNNDKNDKNDNIIPLISPQGENRSSKKTREIKPTETDIEIIDYLNFVCDKSFRPSKSNIEYIHGRLSEGYTIDDFKKVIDIKAEKWKNNPDMNEYLRPSTLFAPKKFDNYLNEKPKTKTSIKDKWGLRV